MLLWCYEIGIPHRKKGKDVRIKNEKKKWVWFDNLMEIDSEERENYCIIFFNMHVMF